QVWLGITLGCAECHSHKYDPITQKEYYQLYAYFTGVSEPMVSGNHGKILEPFLKVPTQEQNKAMAEQRVQMEIVEKAIAKELRQIEYKDPLEGKFNTWKPAAAPLDVVWIDDEMPERAQPGGLWTWGEAPKFPVLSGKKSMFRTGADLHQHFFMGSPRT